jgi:methionyl-tRNA synthetase
MSAFSITTPIYYVNSDLHLGHAYTTVLADVFKRYQIMMGEDAFFLTGVDEHGQKVLEASRAEGVEPKAHCDRMAVRFQELWDKLEITHDRFIRTTDADHVMVVQDALIKLHDKGELYAKDYEGHYCVPCETYFTEKDLHEGNCPQCQRPVEILKERNWFFRMSKYQDWLIEHIQTHPDFIQPISRRNEVLGFLKQPLRDLCISRLKERMSWGIELPFDKDFVCYVWVDALLNYVSGMGYGDPKSSFDQRWPASMHLLGKDILTTHCVYWPTLLKALDIEAPKSFLVHGWWLIGDQKMSKSTGNVVRPLELIDKVGVDPFRFFLIRDMQPWHDASFTPATLVKRINVDLANDLGNLLSRVSNLAHKHFDGVLSEQDGHYTQLREASSALLNSWKEQVKKHNLHGLLEDAFALLKQCNQVAEQHAPWKLVKSDKAQAEVVLAELASALFLVARLIEPVMPNKCADLLKRLGRCTTSPLAWPEGSWTITHGTPLFPRIDEKQFLDTLQAPPESQEASKKNVKKAKPSTSGLVTFADFSKVRLVCAKILSAQAVEGADRLLLVHVDCGEEKPRQVVAGIAKHYAPEDLLGMTVCLVANLETATLRGCESQGMLLATKSKKSLVLVNPGDLDPGSPIG